MPLHLGGTIADALKVGANDVSKAYLGNSLAWEPPGPALEYPETLPLALWLRAKTQPGANDSVLSPWIDDSSNSHQVIPGNANNAFLKHGVTPNLNHAVHFPNNAFFTIGGDLAFASSSYGGYPPANAFDGNSSTYWHSNSITAPHYIGCRVSAGSPAPPSYAITAHDTTAPGTWEFQGSNNPSGPWITLDAKSGYTWTSGQTRTFSLASTTPYKYYRLYITVVAGGSYCRIRDISITNTTPAYIGMPPTGDGELVVVLKVLGTANQGSWVTGAIDSNHYPYSGVIYEGSGSNARRAWTIAGGVDITQWHVYNVSASGTNWSMYINNVVRSTTSSNTTKTWSKANMILGKSPGAGEFYLNAYVAEFMLISRALTTIERGDLYSYLQAEHFV